MTAADMSRDPVRYEKKPLPSKIFNNIFFALAVEVCNEIFAFTKKVISGIFKFSLKLIKNTPAFFELLPVLVLFSLFIVYFPCLFWFGARIEVHHGETCERRWSINVEACDPQHKCYAMTPRRRWRRSWTNWWETVKSRAEKRLLNEYTTFE